MMFDRIISACNVVMPPLLAVSFAHDAYTGKPADLAVWAFAFLGLAYTFVSGIRGISQWEPT